MRWWTSCISLAVALLVASVSSYAQGQVDPSQWGPASQTLEESASNRDVPSPFEPRCYPIRQEVTIDGDLSEWDLRGPIEINRASQRDLRPTGQLSRRWAGVSDASATIYFAYDAHYLYVAGSVADDERMAHSKVWFDGDCVEIFLDTDRDGDRDTPIFDDDDFQLCLMPYNPPRAWGVLKHGSMYLLSDAGFHGVRVASKPTEGAGYVFESCWPWANFPDFDLATRKLGFNVAINDHDDGVSGGRQNYLTVNGAGGNYQSTENFLDLTLVGDPINRSSASASSVRVTQWVIAVIVALGLIVLVARTSTPFVRWVDRRISSWRKAGVALIAAMAVIVFVLPFLVQRGLEWRVRQQDRALAVGTVVADLVEDGMLDRRGLDDPNTLIRLLRGEEIQALPSYSYRSIEILPPEEDPNLRRSVEMVPVRRYGFPLQAARAYSFPLPEATSLSRLYLFGSARLDERARGRPDVSGIRDPALEVTLKFADGTTQPFLFPAFDHELVEESQLPLSDRVGLGWRERDRVVDQYFLGKSRLDSRAVEAIVVEVRDSAVTFRLHGITVASRTDDQLVPLSLTHPSAAGVPAALWDGYPRDASVTVAGGGTRDRYALPIGQSCDTLWFFYSTLDPQVLSSDLAGIEVARFVVRGVNGEEWIVPLRAGVQLSFSIADPSNRPPDLLSRYAFRWTPEKGRSHSIEVTEFSLPAPAKIREIELINLGQLSGITLHAVTIGARAPGLRPRSSSSLVETDRDRVRVRADIAEAIRDLGLAVFSAGRVVTADFPNADFSDSLKGAAYPLGGRDQPDADSERSYITTLGSEKYLVRSFPIQDQGAELVVVAAQKIDGLAELATLRQQAIVVALLLIVPLLLFYLLDGTTRIARLHWRLTTLLVTTSLVPIVLLFAVLFSVVVKDRERLRLSRAETAMQQVLSRFERMYLQTQRTAREVMDSEVVRKVRSTGRASRERVESYLKEAMSLQPVPGLDLAVRVEVEFAGSPRQRFYDRPGLEGASRFDEAVSGVHYHWDRLAFVGSLVREEDDLNIWVTVSGQVIPGLLQELSAATGTEVSLLSLNGFPLSGSRDGDPELRSRDVDEIRRQNRLASRKGPAGELVATSLFGRPGGDPAALVEIAFPPEPFELRVLFTRLPPQTFFFWFCVLGLLGAVFLGTVATWRITEPIESLEAAVRQVARGDLDVVVESRSRGEVGRLARSFQTMVSELRRRDSERGRIERAMAALSHSMDPDATATAAVDLLAEEPSAVGGALYRRDPELDALVLVGRPKGDPANFPTRLPNTPLFQKVLRADAPWILPAEDPDMVNTRIWTRDEERLFGTHLSILLPLPVSDRVSGLVILKYGIPVFRTELEAACPLLKHLAGQASVALDNASLYQLAVRDPQTGLYVESYFRSRLAEEVDRAQHDSGTLSLVQFVLEDLPRLSRKYGPDAVKDELVRLATMLRLESRDMYLVSRSGDGFLVLLPGTDRAQASAFHDRVMREAGVGSAAHGRAVSIRAGIATFPEDGGSAAYLIDAAARDLSSGRTEQVKQALQQSDVANRLDIEPYVFESAAMRGILTQVARVAPSRASVLILGETGSGKEVVAELLHRWSDRAHRPFIALNCAAVPENLLEAELFGYERGAFTGAVQSKPGQLESAHEGTLFLDEVGDMPLPVQSKLLRVLQDGRVLRLGSSQPIEVDVRIIAATHRDLGGMIERGEFRADLYFRLKVVSLTVPPLRERREDIPSLVARFADEVNRERGKSVSFSPAALDRLYSYPWEGNVRELRNVVSRALLLADGELVLPGELQFEEKSSRGRGGSRGKRESAGLSTPRRRSEGESPSVPPSEGSQGDTGLNERQRKLIETVSRERSFRSREYFELVGVAPRTGLRDLNDLMERGVIERLGSRRAAVYRFTSRRTKG